MLDCPIRTCCTIGKVSTNTSSQSNLSSSFYFIETKYLALLIMKTRSQSRSTVVDQVVSSTSPPSPLPMSDRKDDSQCEEDDDSDWSLENMPSMEPNEDSDSEYIRPIASAHKQRQGIATKKVLAHKRPATSVMKQSTCTSSASTTATNDTINALYQKALATSRTLKSLSHEKYNELLAESMQYRRNEMHRIKIYYHHIYASDVTKG